MLVEFFDHFIALKQLVEDNGKVSVLESKDNSITFSIVFNNIESRNLALSNAQSGSVIIYGKPISINVDIISDTEIRFKLQ
jgi:hypothetical protein